MFLIEGCSPIVEASQVPNIAITTTSSTQPPGFTTAVTTIKQVPSAASRGQDSAAVQSKPVVQPTFARCYENNAAMQPDRNVFADVERRGDFAVLRVVVAPAKRGCIGPAAVRGYGYDETRKLNLTSGEIQTYHGYQDGYISEPELCAAAVAVVEDS